jgi:predicted methyltransferase
VLVTPLSPVVAHRLGQYAGLEPRTALRLCQLRASTVELFPSLAAGFAGRLATRQVCQVCGQPESDSISQAAAEEARTLRPEAATAIDQCHVDTESLCRRVQAIVASRPMARSRVAFVGDDDLASVALMRAAAPQRLLVVDIDERILDAVEQEASRLGLADRLAVERADLASAADADGLRARHGETFDIVVTDPPYAHDGMASFLAVAMSLTAYTGEAHVAVPGLLAEAWTDELLHSVQTALVSAGFLIDRITPGAFAYETSDVVSSLVVARRLPGTPPPAPAASVNLDRFYTTRIAPSGTSLSSSDAEGEIRP